MRHVDGRVGTVTVDDRSGIPYLVRWDDADEGTTWCMARDLTPLTPETTAPMTELTINGHRYVLAPEQEPEKAEEKREPKRGEIWRDGSVLYLITQARGHSTAHTLKHGQIYDWDSPFGGSPFDYAYPSLAAAIEAGETFK